MQPNMRNIIGESFPILVLCVIGGVAAGLILENIVEEFNKIPGLILIIPPLLGMRGNISGVLSSRLASALHLGLINPELKWNKTLKVNINSSLLLNVVMSLILGIIAYGTYILTGRGFEVNPVDLVLITLFTGTLAGIILTFLAVVLALYTYASGYDPDNVVSPLLSTVGDLITVLCLLIVTKIVV